MLQNIISIVDRAWFDGEDVHRADRISPLWSFLPPVEMTGVSRGYAISRNFANVSEQVAQLIAIPV